MNNAGVYEFAPLESVTPDHFHKLFDLNVLGLLLTTQEAVKLMNGDGGSVLNISSIVGPMPVGSASVYSATKAAVDALTIALSKELGPRKIRVNSLEPRHGGNRRTSFRRPRRKASSARPSSRRLRWAASRSRTILPAPPSSSRPTTRAGSPDNP